jgi:soluble lytic murein transglycosylase-like protein
MTVLRALGGGLAAWHALWAGAANAAQPPTSEPLAITRAVHEASLRFAVPADWIRAVIKVESAGNPNAVSPKGAMGLMQIMPATWGELRLRYHLATDPYDIHDNVVAGTALLRELYDRFGASGFLAAYNAGPSRYLSFLNAGVPLKDETRTYLTKLAPLLGGELASAVLTPNGPHDWRSAPLFLTAWPGGSGPALEPPSSGNSGAAAMPSTASPDRLEPGSTGLFATLTTRVSP